MSGFPSQFPSKVFHASQYKTGRRYPHGLTLTKSASGKSPFLTSARSVRCGICTHISLLKQGRFLYVAFQHDYANRTTFRASGTRRMWLTEKKTQSAMWWEGVYMDCALTKIAPVGYYHTNAIYCVNTKSKNCKSVSAGQDPHGKRDVVDVTVAVTPSAPK